MLLDMFFTHMVTIFLILLFGIRLLTKKSFRNTETKYFWLTVISCILLVFEDAVEAVTSLYPDMRFWRTLLSVLGYTLRSTAALGLLLVIIPPKKRGIGWWIPSLITFLVCCTAFFTDVAFGFDENYSFYRGPLGFVAFVVPLFYILMILFFTFRRFSEKSGVEKYSVPLCVVFCILATVKGVMSGGTNLNEAIMISSIFFYIMLYSHDNRLDPLTGLLNRQAFYDDCVAFSKSIKAVASIDMNGLKSLNDSEGHLSGDKALKKIGKCLSDVTNNKVLAYRTGGDEFAILFFYNDEEEIARVEKQIKEDVAADGYSLSAGYAVCGEGGDLDKAIEESDRRMYEDKAVFYGGTLKRRKSDRRETEE